MQVQNNTLAINKDTIFVTTENNHNKVSTYHKIIRIIYVSMLTLTGIIATVMFIQNIRDYQCIQEQFRSKSRSPESTIQSSTTLTDPENNEKKKKDFVISTNSNISEHNTELDPKSIDFPTLIPSKSRKESRNSAGQDDNHYNKIPSVRKYRPGLDEVEMMRHGLVD
ncbi:hypothetical protein DINM_003051 [Dirofilaria immitis]|nr:hypothetical protein [Dirofilaria immitis]